MARMTQAQTIARENEKQALQLFLGVLAELSDPRRSQGRRYPLQTVVVTALMAMVCGCDDAEAMGCQTEIAQTIIEQGGNYLLAVKDNQPTLHQDIQVTFAEAADPRPRSVDELPRPALEVFEDVDKGHGRLERRTLSLCRDLSWLTTAKRWVALSFVAQIVRERTVLSTGKSSTETAYYIGSDKAATPATASDAIRRQWAVENGLHWVLDMAFREDEARHRAKNTAHNMTTLRHFALNIIKSDPKRKLGVANSRKRAGWDRNYLLDLLTNA